MNHFKTAKIVQRVYNCYTKNVLKIILFIMINPSTLQWKCGNNDIFTIHKTNR